MRGNLGFFGFGRRNVGGFLAWELATNVAQIGLDGNHPVYKPTYRLTIRDWWLQEPGLKKATAVFCRTINGRLIPLFVQDVTLVDYVPGVRNKEMFFEREKI